MSEAISVLFSLPSFLVFFRSCLKLHFAWGLSPLVFFFVVIGTPGDIQPLFLSPSLTRFLFFPLSVGNMMHPLFKGFAFRISSRACSRNHFSPFLQFYQRRSLTEEIALGIGRFRCVDTRPVIFLLHRWDCLPPIVVRPSPGSACDLVVICLSNLSVFLLT